MAIADPSVEETAKVEARAWELNHPGARSRLPDDVADIVERLADHPYLGTRLRRARGHVRRVMLRRTGFVVVYQVYSRLRIVKLVGLFAKASLGHRR